MLVRDVAYNGLPKADRARLHERYADWLDGEPDAPDEIVGYHLEQAYRYRAELGPPNRRAKQLAADAGERLGSAGMRAFRSRRHARDDQTCSGAQRGCCPMATRDVGHTSSTLV